MFLKRIGLLGVIAGLGIGTAACTDGYGYSGLGVGYGAGYGYADPYYGGGYGGGFGGPGLGYGAGNFGWYNDFYYPGTGVYVYDRYRRPFRWNDGQRRYWLGRGGGVRGNPNWGGFNRNWNDGRGYNDGRGWNGRPNWNGRRDGYDRRDYNRGNWRGRYGNNVTPDPNARFNDGRTAPSGVNRGYNRSPEARAAIRSQRMETRAAARDSISRRQNPNVRPE